MYKEIFVELAKNFGGEYTWLNQLKVWFHTLEATTILTSDKGHAFVVEDALISNEIKNKGFASEDAFSAWLYYTDEKALIFVEGYGVFVSTNPNEKARFVALDDDLIQWTHKNCPCWLHLLLESEAVDPQALMFEGGAFIDSGLAIEKTLPESIVPLIVSKNGNTFDIVSASRENECNPWWNLRNAFSAIKSKDLKTVPCVILTN